jgi:hypothetical protein
MWLAGIPSATMHDARSDSDLGKLIHELCPKGQGAFVPCSNGEDIDITYVLWRLADPDWVFPPEWVK